MSRGDREKKVVRYKLINCKAMTKKVSIKYKGFIKEENRWEDFESDDPKQATPEASGYDEVVEVKE